MKLRLSFRLLVFFLVVLLFISTAAFSQTTFRSFQDVLNFTEKKSLSLQANDIRLLQSKRLKLAAVFGIIDLQASMSGQFTDNTKLPVTVLPGDVFGQPGTTREVQTGTKYSTAISQTVDIKLLNFEGWKNFSLSSLNLEITETENKLNTKSLYENIAAAYYNIVQLHAQRETAEQTIAVADTLFRITENKFKEGLAKPHDVNDSKVNLITAQENARQIDFLITQNYLSLKILCDIPDTELVTIEERFVENSSTVSTRIAPVVGQNRLSVTNFLLKEQYALESSRKLTYNFFIPTLAVVFGNNYNQFNQDFTVTGGNWINSQYIGVRLNFSVPNAATITNRFKAEYDYQLSQKNTEQARIKSELDTKKLDTDWHKAVSQHQTHAEIALLQKETYQKNKNLYNEGLQSLDRTLTSFNALVSANYNLIASRASVRLAEAKIELNNKIN
jgi:outer membrane protein TolC